MALDPHTPGRPNNAHLQWVDDRALIEPLYRSSRDEWHRVKRLRCALASAQSSELRNQIESYGQLGRRFLTAFASAPVVLLAVALWRLETAKEFIELTGGLCAGCFWIYRWTLNARRELEAELRRVRKELYDFLVRNVPS